MVRDLTARNCITEAPLARVYCFRAERMISDEHHQQQLLKDSTERGECFLEAAATEQVAVNVKDILQAGSLA